MRMKPAKGHNAVIRRARQVACVSAANELLGEARRKYSRGVRRWGVGRFPFINIRVWEWRTRLRQADGDKQPNDTFNKGSTIAMQPMLNLPISHSHGNTPRSTVGLCGDTGHTKGRQRRHRTREAGTERDGDRVGSLYRLLCRSIGALWPRSFKGSPQIASMVLQQIRSGSWQTRLALQTARVVQGLVSPIQGMLKSTFPFPTTNTPAGTLIK
jgi:hypothetical protein